MRLYTYILPGVLGAMLSAAVGSAADAPAKVPAPDSAAASSGNRAIPELNLDMIHLAAGQFTIGSPKSEHERYTDEPIPTEVTLTKEYWLGKTEVTQGQWEALMSDNPSKFKKLGKDAPVDSVSWNEAMHFCQLLTERERAAGRLPEGYIYSLPTETQWECACRAGTITSYAGDLDDLAWYSKNAGITTHLVAQKQPNAWGFCDMHGNVWEWTFDLYRTGMLGQTRGVDPAGPINGTLRVLRGGAFDMPAVPARSSYRFHLPPDTKKESIGFRLALTVPPVPDASQPASGRRGRGRRGQPGQPPEAVPQQNDPLQQNDPQQQDDQNQQQNDPAQQL